MKSRKYLPLERYKALKDRHYIPKGEHMTNKRGKELVQEILHSCYGQDVMWNWMDHQESYENFGDPEYYDAEVVFGRRYLKRLYERLSRNRDLDPVQAVLDDQDYYERADLEFADNTRMNLYNEHMHDITQGVLEYFEDNWYEEHREELKA